MNGWQRRLASAATAVPYFVLFVATGLYLGTTDDPQPAKLVNLGIAMLAGLWMLWWFTLHPGWRERRGLMAVFVVGVLVFFAVLGLRNSMFGFFSYAGYIYAIEVLPGRWKFVGVSVTGVLAATSLVGGFPSANIESIAIYVAVVVFVVTLACAITFLSYNAAQQSLKRKQMVDQLAAAMDENASLQAQLLIQAREAGVLDERRRMAREIHDTLAQGFTAIITQLQAAEQSEDWRTHVGTAARLARENLTEARRSVHALRPAQLENAALPEALAEVVNGWARTGDVQVELTTTGTARPMHPEVEVALLRTAQEALANVAKHARASRVGLTLSYMEDLVTLDVRDDGVGFDPEVVKSDGYGLMTMRQRVSRLAGALAVESEPGGGTAVSASVPAIPAEVAR
ncbi:signal transduction histidine kinase [Kibdelosporangium banguiense]|uniref:Oxygen sensor histidine kinase NreB n=1 Tax=Kibdelosporangium banguiense TaxID=1365924 RepID=A0ABS4U1J7_9PSEU|nr:sensor histidine kinase [Kibdelosporangium banguiense]MBP2330528.1 signal transduction histidine kinase [Kibdelosporangium banguiense]